jgi:hypothetical protein
MPAAARTPAQIEAARRNGAKSRGPATEAGKARSSANALKHGLAAASHAFLEGEDRAAYEELLAGLVKELAPAAELEGQLVRRLASALWRQDRADRLEAKLFAWTATPKVIHGGRYQPVDAEAAFDIARLDALRRYRAEASREASRVLRELRLLRAEPPAETRNEPEPEPAPAEAPVTAALRLVARKEPDPTPIGPARARLAAPERSAVPLPNRAERRRLAALERRFALDAQPRP